MSIDMYSLIDDISLTSKQKRIDFLTNAHSMWSASIELKTFMLISDRHENVRFLALNLLREMNSGMVHIASQNAITDKSVLLRNVAAEILGEIGDQSDFYRLVISANDSEWSVRCSVASSLATFGNKAYKTLMRLLSYDSNPHVRRYAAVALADINYPKLTEDLEIILSNEPNPYAQVGLMYTLYKHGQKNYLYALVKLLNTPDYELQNQVLDCLCDVRVEDITESITAINHLLESDIARSVRTKSVETLNVLLIRRGSAVPSA